MRSIWIVAGVVAALLLVGCGGGGSSTKSASKPISLRVTTATDIDEMVNLLEQDEELDGRYRQESKRCAAEHARKEYGEACAQPLEEKLSRRLVADEAEMEKLIPQVGLGCRKALTEESIFDLPEDNSLETCEEEEGR
jgi:hypothetical protein